MPTMKASTMSMAGSSHASALPSRPLAGVISCAMRSLVLSLSTLLQSVTTAGAQGLIRPHLDWRTIDTEHFRIHFPAPMWEWTRSFAARVESVHDIVTAHVGFEPGRRV